MFQPDVYLCKGWLPLIEFLFQFVYGGLTPAMAKQRRCMFWMTEDAVLFPRTFLDSMRMVHLAGFYLCPATSSAIRPGFTPSESRVNG
jgi:hypothetical protein